MRRPATYIEPNPRLLPYLQRVRASGRRTFLLSNSPFDFVDMGMAYLLGTPTAVGVRPQRPVSPATGAPATPAAQADGSVAAGEGDGADADEGGVEPADVPPEGAEGVSSWRDLFDYVICSARKPAFFASSEPFRAVDPVSGLHALTPARSLVKGGVYTGGSNREFARLTGITGQKVMYVGDHMRNDLAPTGDSAVWRTCGIVREIREEMRVMRTPRFRALLSASVKIEALIATGLSMRSQEAAAKYVTPLIYADSFVWSYSAVLFLGHYFSSSFSLVTCSLLIMRPSLGFHRTLRLKALRGKVRAALRDSFNKQFGSIFRTDTKMSQFFADVSRYADIYTSDVTNFLHYPVDHAFYSFRMAYPHEPPLIWSSAFSVRHLEKPASWAARRVVGAFSTFISRVLSALQVYSSTVSTFTPAHSLLFRFSHLLLHTGYSLLWRRALLRTPSARLCLTWRRLWPPSSSRQLILSPTPTLLPPLCLPSASLLRRPPRFNTIPHFMACFITSYFRRNDFFWVKSDFIRLSSSCGPNKDPLNYFYCGKVLTGCRSEQILPSTPAAPIAD